MARRRRTGLLAAVIVLSLALSLPATGAPVSKFAPSLVARALKVAKRAEARSRTALKLAQKANKRALSLKPGAAGPPGHAGPVGAAGPAGAQGTAGVDGHAGPQGLAGPGGPQGPAGPAGAAGGQGPAGPTGPAGTNGNDGAAGPQGPSGQQGPAGPQGASGPQGATGPQGPAGAGGAPAPGTIAILAPFFAAAPWTDQPAALTEVFGATRNRTRAALTNAAQGRIVVNVQTVGAATPAQLCAQYSTDQTTWNYLDGSAGPCVAITTLNVRTSAWVNLAAAAKADVYLRVVGKDGDAISDPAFGNISIEVK